MPPSEQSPNAGVNGRNENRRNNFDALRLIAATLVLVSHCYPLLGVEGQEIFWQITGYQTGGGIGVRMFFVISGYLVTASILRQGSLASYASARALRILPALGVVVLLSAVVLGPLVTTLSWSEYFARKETFGYFGNAAIFFLQYDLPGVFKELPMKAVNGSLWTLPIEVTMYALLAALYKIGAVNRQVSLFIAIGFLAAHMVTQTVFGWNWENRGPQLLHMPITDILGLGVWFWIGSAFWVYRDDIPISGWLAAAALIVFATAFHSPHAVFASTITLPYLIHYAAYAPLRVRVPFGDISYGVYLYAWPVTQCVNELSAGRVAFPGVVGVVFLVTFVLAWLSWTIVEKPMLAFKSRTQA